MKKSELLARIAALEARVRVLEASPVDPRMYVSYGAADAVTIGAGVATTPERAAEIAASIVTAKARC